LTEIVRPYSVDTRRGKIMPYRKKVEVKVGDLKGFFCDDEAVDELVSKANNPMVYEYYENSQPEMCGQLNFGVTIINPGKVGIEYYMTRGHYHSKRSAAEIYFGLKGEGMVMMQTKGGQLAHLPVKVGSAVYVPSFWAHRTINVGSEKLSFLYAYPSDAGHDYCTIRKRGFAKLVVERRGHPIVIDNPKYNQ